MSDPATVTAEVGPAPEVRVNQFDDAILSVDRFGFVTYTHADVLSLHLRSAGVYFERDLTLPEAKALRSLLDAAIERAGR